MQRHGSRQVYLIVSLLMMVPTGCQLCAPMCRTPDPVSQAPATTSTATANGAVLRPGEKQLPNPTPSLKKFIASAGGVVYSKDVNKQDVEMLVHFQRSGLEYYISVTAIEETECGEILVEPGDVFNVVSWTSTDLFRGVKDGEPAVALAAPKDTGNMQAVFDWYKAFTGKPTAKNEQAIAKETDNHKKAVALIEFASDFDEPLPPPGQPAALANWGQKFIEYYSKRVVDVKVAQGSFVPDVKALKTSYGLTTNSRLISFEVFDELGRRKATDKERKVTLSTDGIAAPRLKDFRSDAGLGVLAIAALSRRVDGKDCVFLLSLASFDKKKSGFYSPVGQMLNHAYLFDGDKLTLTLPQEVPIVKASLLAAELRKRAKP